MKCQMIYQDPYDSINPRMTISDIVSEPLEIHNLGTKDERKQRVIETLQKVKLEPAEEIAKKHPHICLLYTSPSPRDATLSRMPSSA